MDNVSTRNVIHSKEKDMTDGDITQIHKNLASKSIDDSAIDIPKRKTSFAAVLPNTTTWQQQSVNIQQLENNGIIYNVLYTIFINLICFFN